MENVLDLRGKSLRKLENSQIPIDTETLLLSNNEFTTLPDKIFDKRSHIWEIDLSYNKFKNIDFLKCFRGIGLLDLRNNSLDLDNILFLQNTYILDLRLDGNNFQKWTNTQPLTLNVIFKLAWILDGHFITDYVHALAEKFANSLAFGETILAARKHPTTLSKQAGVSNAANNFLVGNTLQFKEGGKFISSKGAQLQALTSHPQIERLRYLATTFEFTLPNGEFADYFGLSLGILNFFLTGSSIALVPRAVSRSYWAPLAEDIQKLEHWQLYALLFRLLEKMRPSNQIETDLLSLSELQSYVSYGAPMILGSTPRLLISAFLFNTNEEAMKSEDMQLYLAYRNAFDLTTFSRDFEVIHGEFCSEIPNNAPNSPQIGDKVRIKNPIREKFAVASIFKIQNGRAFMTLPEDIMICIPLNSIFYDANSKIWSGDRATDLKSPMMLRKTGQTFITAADTLGDTESEKQDITRTGVPLPPSNVKPRNVVPTDPTFFLKRGKEMLQTSPFIDRSKRSQSAFRGVVMPNAPARNVQLRTKSTRRPSQVVEGVVNVTLGPENGYGRPLRKFHVKIVGTNSKKVQYVWISEDELPEEDVQRLVSLYRNFIESKMTVIPNV